MFRIVCTDSSIPQKEISYPQSIYDEYKTYDLIGNINLRWSVCLLLILVSLNDIKKLTGNYNRKITQRALYYVELRDVTRTSCDTYKQHLIQWAISDWRDIKNILQLYSQMLIGSIKLKSHNSLLFMCSC